MKIVNVTQIDDERNSLEDDTDFIEASEPLWIPFSNWFRFWMMKKLL